MSTLLRPRLRPTQSRRDQERKKQNPVHSSLRPVPLVAPASRRLSGGRPRPPLRACPTPADFARSGGGSNIVRLPA
jgi:hypothetical protein